MTTTDDTRTTARWDRRRTITQDDRALILRLHAEGHAIRAIARALDGRASRRSIQYIIYPERLQQQLKRQRAGKHHLRYYDTAVRRKHMASHRAHKKTLALKKLI